MSLIIRINLLSLMAKINLIQTYCGKNSELLRHSCGWNINSDIRINYVPSIIHLHDKSLSAWVPFKSIQFGDKCTRKIIFLDDINYMASTENGLRNENHVHDHRQKKPVPTNPPPSKPNLFLVSSQILHFWQGDFPYQVKAPPS